MSARILASSTNEVPESELIRRAEQSLNKRKQNIANQLKRARQSLRKAKTEEDEAKLQLKIANLEKKRAEFNEEIAELRLKKVNFNTPPPPSAKPVNSKKTKPVKSKKKPVKQTKEVRPIKEVKQSDFDLDNVSFEVIQEQQKLMSQFESKKVELPIVANPEPIMDEDILIGSEILIAILKDLVCKASVSNSSVSRVDYRTLKYDDIQKDGEGRKLIRQLNDLEIEFGSSLAASCGPINSMLSLVIEDYDDRLIETYSHASCWFNGYVKQIFKYAESLGMDNKNDNQFDRCMAPTTLVKLFGDLGINLIVLSERSINYDTIGYDFYSNYDENNNITLVTLYKSCHFYLVTNGKKYMEELTRTYLNVVKSNKVKIDGHYVYQSYFPRQENTFKVLRRKLQEKTFRDSVRIPGRVDFVVNQVPISDFF